MYTPGYRTDGHASDSNVRYDLRRCFEAPSRVKDLIGAIEELPNQVRLPSSLQALKHVPRESETESLSSTRTLIKNFSTGRGRLRTTEVYLLHCRKVSPGRQKGRLKVGLL